MQVQIDTVTTKSFRVTDIQLLGASVYRVQLSCLEGHVPAYAAGQYLEILLGNGGASAFSSASAPTSNQQKLELHIQKLPGKENSLQLFQALEMGIVDVKIPSGRCHMMVLPDRPLLLIAAGTGFAQMKSIVEHALNQGHKHPIHLYWGARTPADFYLPSLPIQWSGKGVHYHPVVSDSQGDREWGGRFGLLYEAVISDKEVLKSAEVYISGSPTMVYATMDAILEQGFNKKNINSDVFEYAPRS